MLPTDFIVSSLPTLSFDAPPTITWEKFVETVGELSTPPAEWTDLETQLRNALAEARGGEKYKRPATGASLYWKNRILAAFQEKDVLKRDELIDKVWWDAAGELTPVASPLSKGAIHTYSVRLKIALKRALLSEKEGNAAFDRLTAETKMENILS